MHLYGFHTPRVYITVKASSLRDAIAWLEVHFGESWVKHNLDCFEIDMPVNDKYITH